MANETLSLLPHDINAEEAVLGSILIAWHWDEVMPSVVGILSPRDFYRERNGWAYEAMVELYRSGVGIDFVTVGAKLEQAGKLDDVGGIAYLAYLVSRVPTPYHAGHYARIVRDCADRRRAIDEAGKAAGKAYEGGAAWRKQQDVLNQADVGIDDLL